MGKGIRIHRVDNLANMIPYMFALGCARAWLNLLFAEPSLPQVALPFDPHVIFDYSYALIGIAVALAARKIAPLQESTWVKALTILLAITSSVSMIVAPRLAEAAPALSIIGAITGGITFLSLVLLNAEALLPLSLIRILMYQAASKFIAVPIVYLAMGLDQARLELVIVALPFISLACTSYSYTTTPVSERTKKTWPHYTFPWKPVALFAIYSFVYGLREHQLVAGAGIHSSLATAILSAVLFFAIYLFSDKISLSTLFKSPMVMMVCGLLFVPAEAVFGSTVSSYLISMGNTLMGLMMGLLLYDLSKRMGIAIIALMGIEKSSWLFRVWGSDCARFIDGLPIDEQTRSFVMTAAVIILVVAGTLMLLSEKDISTQWGIKFSEPGGLSEESRQIEHVIARCDEISRQCHLTPREDEILRLLARGMTNPQIEKELFIAAGTLKAHIQHIYVKTGVHSKKELSALFETQEPKAE